MHIVECVAGRSWYNRFFLLNKMLFMHQHSRSWCFNLIYMLGNVAHFRRYVVSFFGSWSVETIYASMWSGAEGPYVREVCWRNVLLTQEARVCIRYVCYVRIDGVRRKDVGQFHTREMCRCAVFDRIARGGQYGKWNCLRTASIIWYYANNFVNCVQRADIGVMLRAWPFPSVMKWALLELLWYWGLNNFKYL